MPSYYPAAYIWLRYHLHRHIPARSQKHLLLREINRTCCWMLSTNRCIGPAFNQTYLIVSVIKDRRCWQHQTFTGWSSLWFHTEIVSIEPIVRLCLSKPIFLIIFPIYHFQGCHVSPKMLDMKLGSRISPSYRTIFDWINYTRCQCRFRSIGMLSGTKRN